MAAKTITDAEIEQALEWIAEDAVSLNTAAKRLGYSTGTMCDILHTPKWSEKYVRAREIRAATLAERAIETSESSEYDPADKRVRLDAYKWFAARLDPKRWSEKTQVEHSGPNGGPIQQAWVLQPVRAPSSEKD